MPNRSLYQALQGARLALAVLAGASAGVAVQWWLRPAPSSVLVVLVAVAFVGLVAEVIPRSAGALLPTLAAAAVVPILLAVPSIRR